MPETVRTTVQGATQAFDLIILKDHKPSNRIQHLSPGRRRILRIETDLLKVGRNVEHEILSTTHGVGQYPYIAFSLHCFGFGPIILVQRDVGIRHPFCQG